MLLYVVVLIFLCMHSFYIKNLEYVKIAFLVGFPLFIGLICALKSRSYTVVVFAALGFISGCLTPITFFYEKEKYTFGGFSAVKSFVFSADSFVVIYAGLILSYFITLTVATFGRKVKVPSANITIKKMIRENKVNNYKFALILYIAIAVFVLINIVMYELGVGITGIEPPRLPFKISGILYYLSRFIFPLLVTLILSKIKPNIHHFGIVIIYALFASITSVSRANLVLMFLPVIIIGYLKGKKILLLFSIISMFTIYPFVGYARNFVFDVENGVSVKNKDYTLVQVFYNTFSGHEAALGGAVEGAMALLERIGGGQDVALAAQYDSNLVGGPFREFIRLYIYDFYGDAKDSQREMYNFKFETRGYSPGDGGYFAHILMVSRGALPILIPLSIFLGLILRVGASFEDFFTINGCSNDFVLFYSIIFNILFFVFSSPLWFNFFLVISFIAVLFLHIIKISFKKYKL